MTHVLMIEGDFTGYDSYRLYHKLSMAGADVSYVLDPLLPVHNTTPRKQILAELGVQMKAAAAAAPDEPMLIFVRGEGRYSGTGMPAAFSGAGSSELRWLMDSISYAAIGLKTPVDVFLLTAQRTDFIHRYAQRLPRGSVIAAVKQGLAPNLSETALIDCLSFDAGQPVRARDILVQTMCMAPPEGVSLWPSIAVSGARQQDMPHVLDGFVLDLNVGGLDPAVRRKVEQHIQPLFDPTALLDLHPAISLMDEKQFYLRMASLALVARWSSLYRSAFPNMPTPAGASLVGPQAQSPRPQAQPILPAQPPSQRPSQAFPVPASSTTSVASGSAGAPTRSWGRALANPGSWYRPGVPLVKQLSVIKKVLRIK